MLGMGERYDATVTGADPGAWLLAPGTVDSSVPGGRVTVRENLHLLWRTVLE